VFLQTTVLNGKEFARRLDKVSGEPAQPLEVDLFSGHRSDVGMVRDLNEDSIMTLEMVRNQQSTIHSIGLYLVADGMGGHAGGEVASGQIVELFSRKAFENLMPSLIGELDRDLPGWLRATVEAANRQVFNLRKTAGTDMGSTLVAAAMVGNHAYITHIGDSRAYMVNQYEIRQITVDHSLVARMIASHQITREEARHHPQRNVIYRTIGDKPNIEVEIQRQILEVDEYLLLCSDGLSGLVNDDSMQRLILSAATPQEACDNLVKAANAAGGDDNISVILVKVVVP
jgi:serine/threonine protein phosphatase PrpC